MATRDTAQLILEVDARIATAQRAVNQLARSITQEAANMDGGLKKLETSGDRVARSLGGISNRTRAGFTQLSFQIGDVTQGLAMGTKASTIFAQQSGQVIQALQIMGGEGNKFLTFLGGPWGLAISTAAVILGTLAGKLFDGGDAVAAMVEKMREQAKQAAITEEADRVWANTLDGVEDALRRNQKALDALAGAEKSKARQSLEAALASKGRLEGIISETRANISLARSLYEVQKARASGPGQRGEIATLGLEGKLGNLDAMESQLARLQGDLANANRQVEEATSQVLKGAASSSAADRITRKYDRLIEAARQRAVAEHKVGDELVRQIALLEKQKDAAIKALSPDKSGGTGSGLSGRRVSFDDAASIARSGGLTVTSAYRSTAKQAELYRTVRTAENPVARPGTSAHEGVNGKWALDIAFAPGLTPQKIKKLYGDQGVSLSAIYKETGHYHIEGNRTQAEIASDRSDQKEATEKERLLQRITQRASEEWAQEQKVTLEMREQNELTSSLAPGIMEAAAAEAKFRESAAESTKQVEDAKRIGEAFVDDVLNPDNWDNWGDAAKRILKDIERQLIELAAINPLKNALFGGNSPTIGSVFGNLFGGAKFDSQNFADMVQNDFGVTLTPRALGGPVTRGTPYIVGERRPELFVPDTNGRIIPDLRMGSSAGSRGGDVHVYQTYKFEGVAITQEQFVGGLMATKSDTIRSIKEMSRRG